MATDIQESLSTYLTDAHSIEEQALEQLRRVPDIAGEPGLAEALREHRRETEGHERVVRSLLEERSKAPSGAKDAVMRAGGAGIVLFASLQPDTPGKLAAHALSYEALEWASYDLLARTADRADEPRVARAAREIQAQERTMMERLEGLFDRTAEASLRETDPVDPKGKLLDYLADAHAIEAQSIQFLEAASEAVELPALQRALEDHLEETRVQKQRLEERLDDLGGKPSVLKDSALRLGGLNWGMFFGVQPDSDGKFAGFGYALEHLEIGGYEQLRRVAEIAGVPAVAEAARQTLREERAAADKLAGLFAPAVDAALAAKAD